MVEIFYQKKTPDQIRSFYNYLNQLLKVVTESKLHKIC